MDTHDTHGDVPDALVTPTPPETPPAEAQLVSPIPVLPQLAVALSLLAFVFGVTYVGATRTNAKRDVPIIRYETLPATAPAPTRPSLAATFEGMTLLAESAIVWDVQTQRILFNKNADAVRPLASITKLMTALVSYELLDPDDSVPITTTALRAEGDSGFTDGESFTVKNLTDLTLIESSNDGAAALGARAGDVVGADGEAGDVFIHAMNVKARELGLTKMHFSNATGLDLSQTEAGAYGSAREVALLMEHLITNARDAVTMTTVDETRIRNSSGAYHEVTNTNDVVDNIDGLIASKTGYTTLSGGNLVVAVDVGFDHPVVIVVLGSTQEGRFADTLALLERTRAYVAHQ